jgi:hypothetical protein
MDRRLYGEEADHDGVATSLHNLAEVLRAQGELSESERLHDESRAMQQRLRGEDTKPK